MSEIKIDTDRLPSNSKEPKRNQSEEREKLKSIVNNDKSKIVSTKKPLSQKFLDTFVNEDANDVKSYILFDVVIPGIKNTILDVLEMAFFGSTSSRKRSSSDKSSDRVSYSSMYKSESRDKKERRNSRRYEHDDNVDYKHIVLKNRLDAADVVDQLHRRIHEYGSASIGDLFDVLELPGRYTDHNWGWTSTDDIGIRRVSNGYLIDVAEAEYLD